MDEALEVWFKPDGSRAELVKTVDGSFSTEVIEAWGEGTVTIYKEKSHPKSSAYQYDGSRGWSAYLGPYPKEVMSLMMVAGMPELYKTHLNNHGTET